MGEDNNCGAMGMTLTILGCGTLGTAILSGLLASILPNGSAPLTHTITNGTESKSCNNLKAPPRVPSHFIACVRGGRPSCARVEEALGLAPGELPPNLRIRAERNLQSVQEADVVLLACQPHLMREVLTTPGIADSLKGKLLVSILAGVSEADIQAALDFAAPRNGSNLTTDDHLEEKEICHIVRAMPNIAASVLESMTVVTACSPPLPGPLSFVVEWIFKSIGEVVQISPETMDISTALCGSGPAFFALMVEAIVDGAVSMGLQRKDALRMAAYTIRGTAAMVIAGQHPAVIRDNVATPGGSTMKGLLALEEGNMRATISNALRKSAIAASTLGQKRID